MWAPGCAHLDHEAVSTLADQAKEEALKSEKLHDETRRFQKLRQALSAGELSEGMSSIDLIRRFGRPVVMLSDRKDRWIYKAGGGSWFSAPRIELYLGGDKKLSRWECLRCL